MPIRSTWLAAAVAVLLLTPASAQTGAERYPTKPVKVIVPYRHDRLTAGVELARQCRDCHALSESTLAPPPPLLCEAQGPAERLAFSFRSVEASLAGESLEE